MAPTNTKKKRHGSITVFALHLGGTNGGKLELDAIWVPPYNAARYGLRLTHSPRQADVVVLLGQATAKMAGPALELLASLPDDTRLILLGSETTSAAPFAAAYATFGPLYDPTAARPDSPLAPEGLPLPPGKHIAAYVAGSPPDPQVILEAILSVSR